MFRAGFASLTRVARSRSLRVAAAVTTVAVSSVGVVMAEGSGLKAHPSDRPALERMRKAVEADTFVLDGPGELSEVP
jgi:hypothetical protein